MTFQTIIPTHAEDPAAGWTVGPESHFIRQVMVNVPRKVSIWIYPAADPSSVRRFQLAGLSFSNRPEVLPGKSH
jgi:hypothetical protein